MNSRFVTLAVLLITATISCTLSSTELDQAAQIESPTTETTPVTQPATVDAPTKTITVVVNVETAPASVQPAATIDQEQFVLPGCTIQNPDWAVYTVKPEDTMASIATKVHSTVAALAQVNCLVDANRIYVGQMLRVPLTYIPSEPVEPPPDLPLIDNGAPPLNGCAVIPDSTQTYIYSMDGLGNPVAILVGTVRFVRYIDSAFVIELSPSNQGWVSVVDAHLEGKGCPDQDNDGGGVNPNMPDNLPVIRNGGTPSNDMCIVVKDPSPGTRYIYGGASSAHAPIAIMGDYLLFLNEINAGYTVALPGWDMDGWIPVSGVSLVGNNCLDD